MSYETFNQANRGKLVISEVNGEVKLERRRPADWQLKKSANNPDYPYRRYVMCPECGKPFYGSASRGRLGDKFPAYHCSRGGHKYFRIKKRDFEGTIENFVKNIKISKQYIEALKKDAIAEWKRRMEETQSNSSEIDNKIEALQFTMKGLTEKIKVVSVESVIKSIESDVVRLEEEIKLLETEKDKKDSEYINMEVIMDNIEYFLELIEDLLLGSSDPLTLRNPAIGVLYRAKRGI